MVITYQFTAYVATAMVIILTVWNFILEKNLKHATISADQMAHLIKKIASGRATVSISDRGIEVREYETAT